MRLWQQSNMSRHVVDCSLSQTKFIRFCLSLVPVLTWPWKLVLAGTWLIDDWLMIHPEINKGWSFKDQSEAMREVTLLKKKSITHKSKAIWRHLAPLNACITPTAWASNIVSFMIHKFIKSGIKTLKKILTAKHFDFNLVWPPDFQKNIRLHIHLSIWLQFLHQPNTSWINLFSQHTETTLSTQLI